MPAGVMHLIDCLDAGGAERMSVNLANHLPRERYSASLCATRRAGPLARLIEPHVQFLSLERRHRFDQQAVRRLVGFIRDHDIRILHAHSTSLFIALGAALIRPYPAVVWHDHSGRYGAEERPAFLYRQWVKRVKGVIAVNETLAQWSRERLRMPQDRVWYIPNFVSRRKPETEKASLPGAEGGRIVCVANLRPEKDHRTLLRALAFVVREAPAAHVILVGGAGDLRHAELLRKEALRLGVGANVSFLGARDDVEAILRACDIGVLSSASEGLPLALIEYGMAGLPAIATRVGQCAEVLDDGRAGILVSPGEVDELAQALLSLLRSPQRRAEMGERFQTRVEALYSPGPVIEKVCQVYDAVLTSN